jgi:putative membrane protein
MKYALSFAAALALASTSAMAQQQNSSDQNSQPLSPQDFVQKVESGTHYEIGASQIAVRKTQNAQVRQFADRMVRDHSRAASALEIAIAADRTIDLPADTPMGSDMNQKIDALNAASGDDFDNAYVQQMVDDHKDALSLFENYARDGSDAKLKTFARETTPTIREHLQMVERLQKMESRAATPPTTGRSSSDAGIRAEPQSSKPAVKPVPPSNSPAPSGSNGAQPVSPAGSSGSNGD